MPRVRPKSAYPRSNTDGPQISVSRRVGSARTRRESQENAPAKKGNNAVKTQPQKQADKHRVPSLRTSSIRRRPTSGVIPPSEKYNRVFEDPIARGDTPSPEPPTLLSSALDKKRTTSRPIRTRPQTARLHYDVTRMTSFTGTEETGDSNLVSSKSRPHTARLHSDKIRARYRLKTPRGLERTVDYNTEGSRTEINLNLNHRRGHESLSTIACDVNDQALATWTAITEADQRRRLKATSHKVSGAVELQQRQERERREAALVHSLRDGIQTLKESEDTIGASLIEQQESMNAKEAGGAKGGKKGRARAKTTAKGADDQSDGSDGGDGGDFGGGAGGGVPNSRLYRPSETTAFDENDFNATAPTLKSKRNQLAAKIEYLRRNPTEVKKLNRRIKKNRHKQRHAACGDKTRNVVKDNIKALKEGNPDSLKAKREARMAKHKDHCEKVYAQRGRNREEWLHYKADAIAARKMGAPPPPTPRWRNTSPVQSRRFHDYSQERYYEMGEYEYDEEEYYAIPTEPVEGHEGHEGQEPRGIEGWASDEDDTVTQEEVAVYGDSGDYGDHGLAGIDDAMDDGVEESAMDQSLVSIRQQGYDNQAAECASPPIAHVLQRSGSVAPPRTKTQAHLGASRHQTGTTSMQDLPGKRRKAEIIPYNSPGDADSASSSEGENPIVSDGPHPGVFVPGRDLEGNVVPVIDFNALSNSALMQQVREQAKEKERQTKLFNEHTSKDFGFSDATFTASPVNNMVSRKGVRDQYVPTDPTLIGDDGVPPPHPT